MAYEREPRRPTLDASSALAGVVAVMVMAGLYWRFSGASVPDWIGYAQIYDFEGGWLTREGRDPLFVALVHAAKLALGSNGYATFRFLLFAIFSVSAAYLASVITYNRTSVFISVIIVVSVLLLKSLVQIREGLSFVIVAVSIIGILTSRRGGWIDAGCGALIASQIHIGAALFALVWILAFALWVAPPRILAWPNLPIFISLFAIMLGIVFIFEASKSAVNLEYTLRDMGVDTTGQAFGGFWKYIYWVSIGIVMLVTRHQILEAAHGGRKFAFAYATVLGAAVLPALYTIAAGLVFTRFYLPAATSLAVRLLFSSVGLGILLVGIRGKANLLTVFVDTELLIYGLRPLLGSEIN